MSENSKEAFVRTVGAATFGALLTVIALTGAFAIADTPRQLGEVANFVASTDGFDGYTPALAIVTEERTVPPSSSDEAGLELQAMYNMFG